MKRKLLVTITSLLLTASCFLSGCGGRKNSESEKNEIKTVINTTDRDYQPADTTSVLAQNGQSDYAIIISKKDNARGDLAFAARELQYFFEQATGARLPIVYDDGLSLNDSAKYIVLGANSLSSQSGVSVTFEEFGEDGSYIKTVENSLFINSCYESGAMYGVYEFLWYNLGVRIYSSNEHKIPDSTQSTIYLKAFDLKNIPDFAERVSGLNERKSETTCYRLGYNKGHGENWYAWCHTYFTILPKETYYATNRDFYSVDGQQLCLSNQDMITEITNVMKKMITEQEFRREMPGFFQLGHEDNSGFCSCDNCKAATELYGNQGGVEMAFINKVADIMNPWLDENYPDAVIKWVTFAYGPTVDPPVTKQADGTYVPNHPEVVPRENVGVMMAPLSCNWAYNLDDAEHNPRYAVMLEGWKALSPEFYAYTYTQIYDDPLVYMDNWSVVKNEYQIWVDLNAQYIFDEGGSDVIPLSELRDYVHSKLMWDTNADVEYYINDFMDNYFKVAAPYLKEYLHRLRTHYKLLERQVVASGGTFRWLSYVRNAPEMKSKEYWPMDWLLDCIELFDEALEVCYALPDSDEKDELIKRVKEERISPIFILMDLYKYELSRADIRYYIDEFSAACEVSGFTQLGQRTTVRDIISDWTACLED